MKRSGPKVYGVLLAICYLEVLIWTTCLLSSCAASPIHGEDAGYLLRETGNLKQVLQFEEAEDFSRAIDLREAHIDVQAQRHNLQRLQEALDANRPSFNLGSPLYLNLFPALKGSPGPYTGVKAIT